MNYVNIIVRHVLSEIAVKFVMISFTSARIIVVVVRVTVRRVSQTRYVLYARKGLKTEMV